MEERISRGLLYAPTAKERGQVLPNFWGSFLLMRTPFVAELPNFTHTGKGWKVCPRQFVFPQQCLLRLTRTVRGVGLSNITCQMSNIKLTSHTFFHHSLLAPTWTAFPIGL